MTQKIGLSLFAEMPAEMVSNEEVKQVVTTVVYKAWEIAVNKELPPGSYVKRHHLSSVYIRHWASPVNSKRLPNVRLEHIHSTSLEKLQINVKKDNSHFYYDLKDKLRYSDAMEYFLGLLVENSVSQAFDDTNQFLNHITNASVGIEKLKKMDGSNRLKLALYIAAQWIKSQPTRMALEDSSDTYLIKALIRATIGAYQKQWIWVESEKENLALSLSPTFPYPVKADSIYEFQKILPRHQHNGYINDLAFSKITLFPYNKSILLIMVDDSTSFEEFLVSLTPFVPEQIFLYKNFLGYEGADNSIEYGKDVFLIGKLKSSPVNFKNCVEHNNLYGQNYMTFIDLLLFNEYNFQVRLNQNTFFCLPEFLTSSRIIGIQNFSVWGQGYNNREDFYSYLKSLDKV